MIPIRILRMARPVISTGISFVGSTAVATALNGGTATIDLTTITGLAQNDIVLVGQSHSSSSSTGGDLTLSTSSSGWTKRTEVYTGTGTTNRGNGALYWKIMGATPDTSIALDGSGNASLGNIGTAFAFRGVHLTTPFDVADTTATGTNGGQVDPPSNTPTSPLVWSVILGIAGVTTGVNNTNSDLESGTDEFRTGFLAETIDPAIGMGFKRNVTAAFDPAAWTGASANGAWAAIHAMLRPA